MPTIGMPELVIIGMILVLVFGASRLPKLGESAGRLARRLTQAGRDETPTGLSEEEPLHSKNATDAELVEPQTPSETSNQSTDT